jgi:hypothetical protein
MLFRIAAPVHRQVRISRLVTQGIVGLLLMSQRSFAHEPAGQVALEVPRTDGSASSAEIRTEGPVVRDKGALPGQPSEPIATR